MEAKDYHLPTIAYVTGNLTKALVDSVPADVFAQLKAIAVTANMDESIVALLDGKTADFAKVWDDMSAVDFNVPPATIDDATAVRTAFQFNDLVFRAFPNEAIGGKFADLGADFFETLFPSDPDSEEPNTQQIAYDNLTRQIIHIQTVHEEEVTAFTFTGPYHTDL